MLRLQILKVSEQAREAPFYVKFTVILWAHRRLIKAEDGLMDRRFLLTLIFCSVSWIFFWELRWKKSKESQIEEWLQGHSLSEYKHLFEGQECFVFDVIWLYVSEIEVTKLYYFLLDTVVWMVQ